MQIWYEILGRPGYTVSDDGQVKKGENILKPNINELVEVDGRLTSTNDLIRGKAVGVEDAAPVEESPVEVVEEEPPGIWLEDLTVKELNAFIKENYLDVDPKLNKVDKIAAILDVWNK